jgi:hypothetical protein
VQDALEFFAMDIGWLEFEGYFDRLIASRLERADPQDSTSMMASATSMRAIAGNDIGARSSSTRRQVGAASEFCASVSASLNATSKASAIGRNPQRKDRAVSVDDRDRDRRPFQTRKATSRVSSQR